jgi:hypothetical protein
MPGTEFDHETAWREVAEPAFHALPEGVRRLYEETCKVARDLGQLPDLTVPWPDVPGFRAQFDTLDDLALATAARVVYYYGHWAPHYPDPDAAGGTWKFSHYCDQVLRERMGLRRKSSDFGACYLVHEGLLRVGVSTRFSWTFDEVAPATRENLAEIRAVVDAIVVPKRSAQRRTLDAYVDAVRAACKQLAVRLQPGFADLLDVQRFMVPAGTWQARRDAERRTAEDAGIDVEAAAQVVRGMRRLWKDRTGDHQIHLFFIVLGGSGAKHAEVLALADRADAAGAEELLSRARDAVRLIEPCAYCPDPAALADEIDRFRADAGSERTAMACAVFDEVARLAKSSAASDLATVTGGGERSAGASALLLHLVGCAERAARPNAGSDS